MGRLSRGEELAAIWLGAARSSDEVPAEPEQALPQAVTRSRAISFAARHACSLFISLAARTHMPIEQFIEYRDHKRRSLDAVSQFHAGPA